MEWKGVLRTTRILRMHCLLFYQTARCEPGKSQSDFTHLKAVSVVSIIIILMRLAGHVTCMEERRVLVGKPEGRRPLGRRRHGWV